MVIKIWEVRKSKGVTLEELAESSGLGRTTINNFENGRRSPRLHQIEQIAKALECKITDLFDSKYK